MEFVDLCQNFIKTKIDPLHRQKGYIKFISERPEKIKIVQHMEHSDFTTKTAKVRSTPNGGLFLQIYRNMK